MSRSPQTEAPHTLKIVATWLMVLIVAMAMGFLWSVRDTPMVETTPVVLPGAA